MRLLLLVCLVLVAACDSALTPTESLGPGDPEGPAEDVTWVRESARPLRTAEPGGDAADLAVLKEIIGDARVVALGEATHGTREFFQMKHRILEYLVREMGFTVFGIEATWAESNDVDRYVHTGEGDAAALLSNLHFWTWNTQEVLDMIHWMRTHNEAATSGATISFKGFDMQFSERAMDDVLAFATRVGGGTSGLVGQAYACWRVWNGAGAYPTVAGAATREECRAGVRLVHDHLAERRAEYEALTSPTEFAHAQRAARIVVQHEHRASRDWEGREPNPRDRYMAENAEWLLDQAGPDARMVLWAHNAHVWYVSSWMGDYLKATYGADMVTLGFSFARGSFNAVTLRGGQFYGLAVHGAGQPLAGSYESHFERVDLPHFFLDLRPLRTDSPASAAWLDGPLPHRLIGAAYDPTEPGRFYSLVRLPAVYDAVIHFQETRPSLLLPFVGAQAPVGAPFSVTGSR